jgi:membrane fusion protein, multidrug efflux system
LGVFLNQSAFLEFSETRNFESAAGSGPLLLIAEYQQFMRLPDGWHPGCKVHDHMPFAFENMNNNRKNTHAVILGRTGSLVPPVNQVFTPVSAQPNRNPWRDFLMNISTRLMTTHPNPLFRVACSGIRTSVLLCAALAITACEKPTVKAPESNLVRTVVVEPMSNIRSDGEASYLASVKFDHETDLNFKVGGIVTVIGPAADADWDEGTPVKAGTVLAELKQSDFQNALDTAIAKAELADKTLERFQKLSAKNAVPKQQVDMIEAEWHTAQAALDQAKHNLRDSRLLADMNGVILARYINRGVTVQPGQKVLRFADTSLMSVELGLPDRLIGKMAPGQEIDVEISALEGMPPFKGRISEVGVAASGDGRLFRVVIKVPNPDGLLRSGMTARIRVGDASATASGTVCIPLSALVTLVSEEGSQVGAQTQLGVFVVEGGKAVKRAVKTGDILSSSIIITEGLRAGEQVVTSGASFLYDGAPIKVAPELTTK